jgi:hypothetical protein
MAKKKTVRKIAIKKSKGQKTVIVIKTVHSAKDTLFPEKLKKANALLKDAKFINF